MKEYISGPHKLVLDFNLNIALVFTKGQLEDRLQIFIGGVTGVEIFNGLTMDSGDMEKLYNEISIDLLKQKREL